MFRLAETNHSNFSKRSEKGISVPFSDLFTFMKLPVDI